MRATDHSHKATLFCSPAVGALLRESRGASLSDDDATADEEEAAAPAAAAVLLEAAAAAGALVATAAAGEQELVAAAELVAAGAHVPVAAAELTAAVEVEAEADDIAANAVPAEHAAVFIVVFPPTLALLSWLPLAMPTDRLVWEPAAVAPPTLPESDGCGAIATASTG